MAKIKGTGESSFLPLGWGMMQSHGREFGHRKRCTEQENGSQRGKAAHLGLK
jgi:hypothetical protein